MAILAEIFFAIFQYSPNWDRTKRSHSSKLAAIALFAVLLIIILLIWKYNPVSVQETNDALISS